MEAYLGVGVVLQGPDEATSEFANVALDLGDIIAQGVQFGQQNLIPVRTPVPMPARYQSPSHDHDQDSDWSYDFGQASEVFHVRVCPCPSASSESGRLR